MQSVILTGMDEDYGTGHRCGSEAATRAFDMWVGGYGKVRARWVLFGLFGARRAGVGGTFGVMLSQEQARCQSWVVRGHDGGRL